MAENKVVILIIVHKQHPDELELASLKQCTTVLGSHPIKLVVPDGLDITEYLPYIDAQHFDFIDPVWQSTYANFNRLKILPFLYNRYRAYEFILFYELDAWVFRDELHFWCDKQYDFIGAPWFEGWQFATPDSAFIGIGNGGFSLRKVSSHLRVLRSLAYITPFKVLLRQLSVHFSIKSLWLFLKRISFSNNTFSRFNDFTGNEDYFWGIFVSEKFKWFKVPDLQDALKFSIEVNPQLYIRSETDLPFGCHAWYKYNKAFWDMYIDADLAREKSGKVNHS